MMPPNAQEKKLGKHPTQKPLALVSRCLRASTNSGDLVVDPFVGSGTTGVAALQLGRQFLGCEREENFIRLASKRLARFNDFSEQDELDESSLETRNLFSGLARTAHGD